MSRAHVFLLLALVVGGGAWFMLTFVRGHGAAGVDAGRGAEPRPAGQDAGSTGPPQGHVYAGVVEEPRSFNPFTTDSRVTRWYVQRFTHDTLLDLDPRTATLRPALATSYEVAADDSSMTVTLRKGVRFADGSPVTIDDVLFTWDVAHGKDVVLGSIAEGMRLVGGVEVLDAEQGRLRIDFTTPYFAAPLLVAQSWIVVQRRWYTERIAEQAQRDGVPAPGPRDAGFGTMLERVSKGLGPGTGPYVFRSEGDGPRSLRPGTDLRLFRNEHSWRRELEPGWWNFEGVRLLFLGDANACYAALVQRQIDWHGGGDLDALLRQNDLAADYRKVVYDNEWSGPFVVQWNTARPHLHDPRVRRALSLLWDREGICANLLDGLATPAVGLVKPGRCGYPADVKPDPYRPDEAMRLLAEAGYGASNPLRLELLVPIQIPWLRQAAETAAGAARQIGVDLQPLLLDFQEVQRRRQGTDWDGLVVRMDIASSGDPYDAFHSGGSMNLMRWSNDEADRLLAEARSVRDGAERDRVLQRFHRLVANEQPVTFLVQPQVQLLLNRHIENVEVGPLGLWPERWWMPEKFQRRWP